MRKPSECVLGMMLEPNKLEALRTQVCGTVILPGHAQYDASREIRNRFFDRRPSVTVRCTSAADVSAAIGPYGSRNAQVRTRNPSTLGAWIGLCSSALLGEGIARRACAICNRPGLHQFHCGRRG